MKNHWLKKTLHQPFQLDDCGALHFTDLHETLDQQLARPLITVLPNSGSLSISGSEAEKFLQGQLSCDLGEIEWQRSSPGVHCTPQGRVVANFRTCQTADQTYCLLLPRNSLALLQKSLSRYIVFSRATMEDRSDANTSIGLQGEGSAQLVRDYFGEVPETTDTQVNSDEAFCVRLPGTNERYQLWLPHEQARAFWLTGSERLHVADSLAWELLDIRSGLATVGTRTTEMYVPQMLNFDCTGAISFSKGCYTGQEVVARAHYRGAVKRRLKGFKCTTRHRPSPNNKVLSDNKQVGTIVAAVHSKPGLLEGLMVLAEGTDTALRLTGPEGPVLEPAELNYED